MGESYRATGDWSREPSKSHQESERVTRDSARVEKTGEDSVESCEPGKTRAKSQTRGEPLESPREPPETHYELRSKGKDSVESGEPGRSHDES